MSTSLSLRSKLLSVAALGIAGSAVIGYVGYRQLVTSTTAAARLAATNSVQRAQMDADMMHDAIRADVYGAILALNAGDNEKAGQARKDLTEHSERFSAQLAKVIDGTDNAAVRATVVEMRPKITGYVAAAPAVSDSMAVSAEAGKRALKSFEQQFTVLEGDMEKVGDLIEARSKEVGASTTAAFTRSKVELVLATVVSLVGSLFMSNAITSGVTAVAQRVRGLRNTSIPSLKAAIEGLSRGDLSLEIEGDESLLVVASSDEVGELTQAVNDIISMTGGTTSAFNVAREHVRRLIVETGSLAASARAGDLSKRGAAGAFDGSFRELLVGVHDTLDAVIAPIDATAIALDQLARRDLTARVHGSFRGDHARMQLAFNTALERLAQAMTDVAGTADGVAASADQIDQASKDLARGASVQAAVVEEVSASARLLASTTRTNAVSAGEGATLAEEARRSTADGVSEVKVLADAIQRIKASAESTAKIVKTIDEIAFQTNLLALNAAVEAARAGDSGKGFAVVADEVRNLAMRSAEAAKSTAVLIEESVESTVLGVSINARMATRLADIDDRVNRVGQVVAAIAEASGEQARSVSAIDEALKGMTERTQSVAASAEESERSSHTLTDQSAALRELVGDFQLAGIAATQRPRQTLHAA